jgi:hypothetical protein
MESLRRLHLPSMVNKSINSKPETGNAKPFSYPFPNSCERRVALTTASITVP